MFSIFSYPSKAFWVAAAKREEPSGKSSPSSTLTELQAAVIMMWRVAEPERNSRVGR